jgi:hypothetical protein
MTDRELLEAAAKAAGFKVWRVCVTGYLDIGPEREAWSPLADDCDAFRLAVQLSISVTLDAVSVYAVGPNSGDESQIELLLTDPCAAVRRAIVRAAAATVKS